MPKRSNKLIIGVIAVAVIVVVAVVLMTVMNGVNANTNVSRSAEDISLKLSDMPQGWDRTFSNDYDLSGVEYDDYYAAIFTSDDGDQMVSCGIYKFSSVDAAKNYFAEAEEDLTSGSYDKVSSGFNQCIKTSTQTGSYYYGISSENYIFQDRNVIGAVSFSSSYNGEDLSSGFIQDKLNIIDSRLN